MQRVGVRVRVALDEIELAALECLGITGIGKQRLHVARRHAGKLAHELAPAFAHRGGELGLVVGEERERARGRELLPLEKQRRGRREEQQRRDRAISSRSGELMDAQAEGGVRDLVVVLDVVDEPRRLEAERGGAAAFALPLEALPLEEIAAL